MVGSQRPSDGRTKCQKRQSSLKKSLYKFPRFIQMKHVGVSLESLGFYASITLKSSIHKDLTLDNTRWSL